MTLTQTRYELPPIQHAFDLTEEERMIRDMVREFAETEVAPIAHEIDENHRFPTELWPKLFDLGLAGIPFSEEVGGSSAGVCADCCSAADMAARRFCCSATLPAASKLSAAVQPRTPPAVTAGTSAPLVASVV